MNHASQRRAPVNSPRYAHMLPTAPGHSATVLVAFATRADRPSQTMAGNVTSVPPPATELTPLPIAAARKMRMNDGMDKAAVSLLASFRCATVRRWTHRGCCTRKPRRPDHTPNGVTL